MGFKGSLSDNIKTTIKTQYFFILNKQFILRNYIY